MCRVEFRFNLSPLWSRIGIKFNPSPLRCLCTIMIVTLRLQKTLTTDIILFSPCKNFFYSTDMILTSNTDMILNSNTDTILTSSTDTILTSSTDMILTSSKDMILTSSIDMILTSSTDMILTSSANMILIFKYRYDLNF